MAPESGVAWWGTVPAATVPTSGIALAYEVARGPVVLHLHSGLHFRDTLGLFEELDLGLGVAPIAMSKDPTLQVIAALRKRWR